MLNLNGGKKLRIVEQVAANWGKMASKLGFDNNRISTIAIQVHYDPEEACFKMFDKWLRGEHDLKPPKWYYLIKCLEETADSVTGSEFELKFRNLAHDLMIHCKSNK